MKERKFVQFGPFMGGDPSLEDWPPLSCKRSKKIQITDKPNREVLISYIEHRFTEADEKAVIAETNNTIM